MAGKMCNGGGRLTSAAKVSPSRAFCEGMLYRSGGTAVQKPKIDNPLEGEDLTAWDSGWDVAEAAKGGTISAADAGCCAMVGVAVSA